MQRRLHTELRQQVVWTTLRKNWVGLSYFLVFVLFENESNLCSQIDWTCVRKWINLTNKSEFIFKQAKTKKESLTDPVISVIVDTLDHSPRV